MAVTGIGQQGAGAHQHLAELLANGGGFFPSGSDRNEKPNWLMARIITRVPPESSMTALMICTTGGRDHAAEGDVNHHQDADGEDGDVVVQPNRAA